MAKYAGLLTITHLGNRENSIIEYLKVLIHFQKNRE